MDLFILIAVMERVGKRVEKKVLDGLTEATMMENLENEPDPAKAVLGPTVK
jgi:hypothetical protein